MTVYGQIHWNTVITIDVFLLLGSEIYSFWLIDWLVPYQAVGSLSEWQQQNSNPQEENPQAKKEFKQPIAKN